MKRSALLVSTAVSALWLAAPVMAQGQPKQDDGGASRAQPQMEQKAPSKGDGAARAQQKSGDRGGSDGRSAQMKDDGGDRKSAGEATQPKGGAAKSKSADGPKSSSDGKSTASKKSDDQKADAAERKSKSGAAKKSTDAGDKSDAPSKQAADGKAKQDGKQASDPKQAGDGKQAQDGKQTPAGKQAGDTKAPATDGKQATDTKAPATDGKQATDTKGDGNRQQLSEADRTRVQTEVRQTVTQRRDINRVQRTNINISIGARLPRDIRVVALPPTLISVVPAAYRSYHYVVIEDEFCIVDPATYEVVDVIYVRDGNQNASRGGGAVLTLNDSERALIMREVRMGGSSTLGIGVMTVGTNLPADVDLRPFPDEIVERVPKVKGYRYFTAEDRIAIVGPESRRVQVVVDRQR